MTEHQADAANLSPCVGICEMDEAGERCLGCHRTLPEIAAWSRMSAADQLLLNAELEGRATVANQEDEVD